MGHWYKKDGEPCYYVPKAKGDGMRDATLRDARKLDLVPSVTEVIKEAAAPGLQNWLIQQAYLAMATLPEIEGESVDDRIKRAKKDAAEQANVARDKGVAIHDALEMYFVNGRKSSFDLHEYLPIIDGVEAKLKELFGEQDWAAEISFASHWGFGGKVDLHCPIAVVDFKTKEFSKEDAEGKKPKKMAYDNHGMQLEAYRVGLGLPDGTRKVNLFISTSEPGLVHAEEHEWDYWDMFHHLLGYWKQVKRYNPYWSEKEAV